MAKKKGKPKVKHLYPVQEYNGTYGFRLVGLLGWTVPQVEEFFLKNYSLHESPNSDGCTWELFNEEERTNHIIVYTAKWSNEPEVMALFAHECLHVCFFVMNKIGQKVDNKEHEYLTYLHQWVFQTLMSGRMKNGKG